MTMNMNVLRGVCYLLGLDPKTTSRIEIDPGERTVSVSTISTEENHHDVVFHHAEHRIASDIQKPGWEITDDGYIQPREWQPLTKLQEESPIFCATAVSHNRTLTRRDRWAKL